MGMFNKLFGKKKKQVEVSIEDATDVSPMIKTEAGTGDKYVDTCLKIEFQETHDGRKWYEMPECKAVVEAGNAGRTEEALRLVKALRDKYQDFWFPYYWLNVLYRKQKRYDDALKALFDGLRLSKSKYVLCAMMGSTRWETDNLLEAVKWWIRAIIIQIATKEITDDEPFLQLSYVAWQLGLKVVCLRLRRYVDAINRTKPRLIADAANRLYIATRLQGTESMKRTIALLDQEYLSRDLSISSIEDFIDSVVSGDLTAECLIQITDYQHLYDRLAEDLKKFWPSDFRVPETLWDCLSGTCPKCGKILDGPQLTALGQLRQSNSPAAAQARMTPIALRFGQGLCPNEKCSSREVIILWHLR